MSNEEWKPNDQKNGYGKLSSFSVSQKSKFQLMSNNTKQRVYPLDNNLIVEENSILEKDTPIIHFNNESQNKQDIFSPQNSYNRFIFQSSIKDVYNRHYSVDVSKFQSPLSQSESNQQKSGQNIEDNLEEQFTKRSQFNTNQNLQISQGENQLQTNEKESDKKTTEITEMQNKKNPTLFALNYNKDEPRKRYSEFIPSSQKLGFSQSSKILRRNGVAPNQNNKQLLGRITFLNVQSAQNQASSENESVNQENQQVQNSNGISSYFNINKKLSLSWRFINILVLIQNLINKLKISSQTYRLSKLNSTHYFYINDITHIVTEKRNIYKNQLTNFKEFLTDLKIIKLAGKLSVLQPEKMFVVIWKTLMLIIILSQILYLPIKIAFFNFHPELKYISQILLNYLPLAACICDILINFNLAFFSAEGVVIQDRVGIITNYLRFSFWLDLVTTISLGLPYFQYLDLCFFLRLFQFLEIVNYLDERFQFSQRFNTAFTLIKLIATIIILAHIFGCGFYYMSFYDPNYNWVVSCNLINKPWETLYLKSVYFIIITMITVGFGDITPKNNAETIYVLGIALLSCFQFGYTVNIIGSLFQEKAQKEAIIKAQKYQISTYMRQRMINTSLQTLVLKNLDYIQTQQIDAPEQGLYILDQVSENLKNQVKFEFYWKILKNQPFLNHYFSQNFLKSLTSVMTEKTYIPGEFVYQINEQSQSNSLYILLKGQVDLTLHSLYQKNSKKKFTIQSKKSGELFGHHSFFTSSQRETDCECHVTSHIVSCTQDNFLAIAKEYPNDYEKYCFIKDQILLYQNDKNIKCVACHKFGHSIIDCPFIHNMNHKELVIQKFNYSEDQKRNLDFTRKLKKNNTFSSILQTRKDLKKLRIKLVKSIEQQREKKQRKTQQTTTTGGVKEIFSSKFITQSPNQNNQNQSNSENSSVDSSDLSDYKYEMQLEEEKNLLKKQHQNFPYMSSYYDKQFYQRYSKISLNDKLCFISSSNSSEDLSEESKSESEQSEGTIFMNSINYNQTINEFDVGFSETKIDEFSNQKIGSQKKLKKMKTMKGVSKLNQKIAQIIKYNQDNIQMSIDQKNLRHRTKLHRPDSAPQRKSIIENQETITNKLQNFTHNKKRPSSVKLRTDTNIIYSDDSQEELNSNEKNQKSQNFTSNQIRSNKNSKTVIGSKNSKTNYQVSINCINDKNFSQQTLEAYENDKPKQQKGQKSDKRFSNEHKLSKSQIVSEESLDSSQSSKINAKIDKQTSSQISSKSFIQDNNSKDNEAIIQQQLKITQHDNLEQKLSSNMPLKDKINDEIANAFQKTSNASFDNQFDTLNTQEGIGSPKNLLQIYKNQQQIKPGSNKFITSIKINSSKQKIDIIKKHLLDDIHEDLAINREEKISNAQKIQPNVLKNDTKQSSQSLNQIGIVKFDSNMLSIKQDDRQNLVSNENQKQYNKLNLNPLKKEQNDSDDNQKFNKTRSKTIHLSKKKIQNNPKRHSNNGLVLQNQLQVKDTSKVNNPMLKSTNMNNSTIKLKEEENTNSTQEQNQNQKDKNIKVNTNHEIQNNHNLEDKNQLDFFQTFDKMKIFKIYFPKNNINIVLESYTKYSVKKFLASRLLSNKNQSSIVPVIGQQNSAVNFVNILKKRLLNKQRHSIIPPKQN
ncbi:cation channel family protein (macronuclear) [Tetrahymena thermophila SB210]|uniref:Cation channel family protein n=1 Tax=Tetrahymena thermophila (strain SB210) TaxID=312017 RepID=Q22N02_TETTS|nr:cation channel family protein [Tetrahymena thermophila SB210]EAR86638.2 cation channel family protein [Tetrahymena thermophila SB210]|eukprot:XP_976868.2 cation channel family protein [Tetrahymena thermophila SB210]